MKSRFTKEEIQILKEELPRGAMLEIAKITGYSAIYVRQILNGQWENDAIIEAALQYRDARRAKVQQLRERILS